MSETMSPPPADFEAPEPNWERTIDAVERTKLTHHWDEPDAESKNGYFDGRPIIGRDTPINSGVYIGGGSREAVVVDDRKDEALGGVYQELLNRLGQRQQAGESYKNGLLDDVYELTLQHMPYNEAYTDDIASRFKDKKVALDVFIDKGGVCRHQALLAGYLLERLNRDGYVGGKVSVDRNAIKGVGAHAWVRYENSGGDIFIIDPAQEFIGSLEESRASHWFYARPEDALK